MRSRPCAVWFWLAAALAPPAAADFDPPRSIQFEGRAEWRSQLTWTREERALSGADPSRDRGRREDSALWLNRLRIEAAARWADRWAAEISYDQEWLTGSALDGVSVSGVRGRGMGTWLDADRSFHEKDDLQVSHWLYRAWLRYEGEALEVTLGRQRIALGRGRLWNPTDLFNPIPPLAVQADQRIGEDALLLRARVLPRMWAALIWAPRHDPDRHRAAARLEWSEAGIDAALMLASIERDRVLGADFARNLGGAALRGELTHTWRHGSGRFWQAVVSIDHTFRLGSGLYALLEHFFNQNRFDSSSRDGLSEGTAPSPGLDLLARRRSDGPARLVTRERNLTGMQLGYDLTPLVRVDLLWLHDWHGSSDALVPSLRWSARDDLELGVGVQLFSGERGEYGEAANLFFVRFDAYF